jgi:hypothetical protein
MATYVTEAGFLLKMTSVGCAQTSWYRTPRACAVMVVRCEGSTVRNSSEHVICPHKHELKVSGLVNEVAWHVDFHSLKPSVVAIQVSFDTSQTELYRHFVAVTC